MIVRYNLGVTASWTIVCRIACIAGCTDEYSYKKRRVVVARRQKCGILIITKHISE